MNNVINLEVKNYKILINIEVIIFYDLPFEIVFVILKWHLNLVCWCGIYILQYFR